MSRVEQNDNDYNDNTCMSKRLRGTVEVPISSLTSLPGSGLKLSSKSCTVILQTEVKPCFMTRETLLLPWNRNKNKLTYVKIANTVKLQKPNWFKNSTQLCKKCTDLFIHSRTWLRFSQCSVLRSICSIFFSWLRARQVTPAAAAPLHWKVRSLASVPPFVWQLVPCF